MIFVFFDHHFLHKMHGLDNMIHMYINSSFCTCQSQVLYLLYLHLPFANTHVVKYHESSVHPSHVWNVRIKLDAAINVKSAMFKTLCCLKIAGGFTSQCIGDYQGAPINQPAYCNQMGLEHRWCESSTWIDVWHILAPCMVNNSQFFKQDVCNEKGRHAR